MWVLSMTDKRTLDTGPAADDTRETRIQVYKRSQGRLKTNKHSNARKHILSPSASLHYPNGLRTPKRTSQIRFNACSNADSPSEAENQQDIIWDPASPPPMWNGKGEGVRIVEISDIVNRIAPNDQNPVDRDIVLQWIGDSAIPCTPEIQQPRVRKCAIRRQSNNVEGLMELAKQFDLSMIRQDKERTLERPEDNEERSNQGLQKLSKFTAHHPQPGNSGSSDDVHNMNSANPRALSHEEELHVLFDGPTQHLSGRLSPPSANCSQESRTVKAAVAVTGSVSLDVKSIPEDAVRVSKPDFDDDWENDDILNDIFVLEMTQNPVILMPVPPKSTTHTGSTPFKKLEPTVDSSISGSDGRTDCSASLQHDSIKQHTRISTKTCTKPTAFRTGSNDLGGTVPQMPKTSPDLTKIDDCENRAQTICSKQQAITTSDSGKMINENKSTGVPRAKEPNRLAQVSGKASKTLDLDALWGDRDDDDDDLLYQVCGDVERISASQELQAEKCTKLTSNKPSGTSSKTPSSSSFSSTDANSRTVPSCQTTNPKQPVRVFERSHSVPGVSSALGTKQDIAKSAIASLVSHDPKNSRQVQYQQDQKRDSGAALDHQWSKVPSAENSSISHHSTFKRHQSDPVPLLNKVFVTGLPAVKCTAAEIERKKQEALARRRLRLQATQKSVATTYTTTDCADPLKPAAYAI